MEFLIITGLSGAGKTHAADVLEDMGYYCVDNMPAEIMPRFAEFCAAGGGKFDKVALVSDIREKGGINTLLKTIDELRSMDCNLKVLFMNADVRTLINRYKETRRRHPIAVSGETLEESINREMELMEPVKKCADYIVDSSNSPLSNLQHKLEKLMLGEETKPEFGVTVESFGYKYGLPADADLVIDARFLPNPYYVEDLRTLTGMDRAVAEYVFSFKQTTEFMEKLENMVDFLLPLYQKEGKPILNIAVGCTGGRHRSVAIANALNTHLLAQGVTSNLINRDIDK